MWDLKDEQGTQDEGRLEQGRLCLCGHGVSRGV